MEILPAQSQKSPKYCALCTPAGKLCPTEYLKPFKSDWSDDLEVGKDTQGQNKDEDNFFLISMIRMVIWTNRKNRKCKNLRTMIFRPPNQA